MTVLREVVRLLRDFDGISRKFVLPEIISRLREASFRGDDPHSLGEDSAVVTTESDELVLHTIDAIVEEFCTAHPREAGFNVVLANVMDIYAAGGFPTSFAVALAYSDPTTGGQILEGLIEGSHIFRVPIARGHTNPSSRVTYVVGSATGSVGRNDVLTAGGARPGDVVVLVYDRTGARGSAYRLGWDSVTGRRSEDVVLRLSVMNEIARHHVVTAAKDISVAGLVGTAGMLFEYSGVGGHIDLQAVRDSCPPTVPLIDWLRMYISLGFLLTAPKGRLAELSDIVARHGMSMHVVGVVDSSSCLMLRDGDEEAVMFDFSAGPVLTPRRRPGQGDDSPS